MMVYATSFLYNSPLKAMVTTLTFFMATGIVGFIANSILSVLANFFESLKFWDKLLDISLGILNPVYALNRIITEVSAVYTTNRFQFSYNAWDYDNVLKYHI